MRSPIVVGYWTMVRKDFVRLFRIWSQTFLPPVVTMTLYFVIFGAFIGSQVADISGFSYMQFIVPGLVMMAIITNAFMQTIHTFFFAKWMRTIDEVLVSPMPDWVVIAGYVTGGVMRAFFVGVLVLLVSLFFTHLTLFNVWVLVAAAFLTSTLFALIGMINAIYAKSMDAISIVPNFVLTPLTYLGGIFYSITLLPPFFQTVSLFNPILYMVNAFRYGFLGITDVSLTIAFAVMIFFNLIALGLTVWLFKKGVGLKT